MLNFMQNTLRIFLLCKNGTTMKQVKKLILMGDIHADLEDVNRLLDITGKADSNMN